MKRIVAAFATMLLLAIASPAQQAKQAGSANPSNVSKKLATISGQVGPDGKTFATDKDKAVWTVTNPEALLDSLGERVSLRARIDAARHELQVISVGIDLTASARLHDAAFRR
jgi:hypothetical protein